MKAYTLPAGNPPEAIEELRELVGQTRGRFFSVLFVSRGRNEKRKMLARLKIVEPGTWLWSRTHTMAVVWDVQKKDWRSVPLERVVHFKCGGVSWVTPL